LRTSAFNLIAAFSDRLILVGGYPPGIATLRQASHRGCGHSSSEKRKTSASPTREFTGIAARSVLYK